MEHMIITRLMELCDDSIESSEQALKFMDGPKDRDAQQVELDIDLVKTIKFELIKEVTYHRIMQEVTTYFEEAVDAEDAPGSADEDTRFKDFVLYMYTKTK